MKIIKVLGSGCSKCTQTFEIIKKIAQEEGVEVEVQKVSEPAKIMQYKVLSSPAIVIDEKVVHVGSIPKTDLIRSWLKKSNTLEQENNMTPLDQNTVAMLSLAAGIASNHPAMGQCQLKRLRDQGVSEDRLAAVIEIARHIRDEAVQELDQKFDQASQESAPVATKTDSTDCGCTPTASGQSCC